MAESVKVFCRFRPFNKREIELGADKAVELIIKPGYISIGDANGEPREFPFDYAFDKDTPQDLVFSQCAEQSVDDVFTGFNGTIFAYGQTGSGKSWSMMGDKNHAELKGIIPRASELIFEKIGADASSIKYDVTCSYLEVYREQIGDLLNTANKNLAVREHPSKGIYVDGLTEKPVGSWEEVLGILEEGDSTRAVASTNMNAVSSRSHSVFVITVAQETTEGSKKQGKLNLVDLAGSEKIGKTGAKGQTLEEAKKINQSLSALGQVIKALADAKAHIPYRDSKLTRILQEALGGNSKTSLIVACSPHLDNIDETLSTLQFAKRAKTIKNKVRLNETKSVGELEAMVKTLTEELEEMKGYCAALGEALTKAGVDPKTITASAGKMAPSTRAGGGGGNPEIELSLRTELAKLNSILKIAQEDSEEAQKQAREAVQSAEAAMAEGGAAKEEMEKMAMQREKERQLAVKAIGELKKMHAKNGENNRAIKQQAAKEAELNSSLQKALDEKNQLASELAAKEDACTIAESKLNTIQMKLDALNVNGEGGQGGDGDAAS